MNAKQSLKTEYEQCGSSISSHIYLLFLNMKRLTSKVPDGEVLVLQIFLWQLEGELLSSRRQVLVLCTKYLDHLLQKQN